MDLKNQVEGLLFASGKKLSVEFLAKTTDTDNLKLVNDALKELKSDYESRNSALMITDDEQGWKINVREKYLSLVRKIVSDAELSKTIMETLAVIAWKSPVLQSDIINIRTNKAYDHISELLDTGFITKEKHGRSYIIKVSNKFYEYFDVEGAEGIREVFAKIKEKPGQKKVNEFDNQPKKLGELDIVNTVPDNSVKKAENDLETEKIGKLEIYEQNEESDDDKSNDDQINLEEDDNDENIETKSSLEDKAKKIVDEMLNDDDENSKQKNPNNSDVYENYNHLEKDPYDENSDKEE